MPKLESGLPAEQRIILAIDTSNESEAAKLTDLAHFAGATVVKYGLEISSATSWKDCSDMAFQHDVDWIADAKIDDIPNTTVAIINNLSKLKTPPVGITIHTNSGVDSLREAQKVANKFDITMFAVTELTSKSPAESMSMYGIHRATLVKRRAELAYAAGIKGLVCSPLEIKNIKKEDELLANLITMIPGTRSEGANTNDQKNVITPRQAIIDGADLLVIGRQITTSDNPEKAFTDLTAEINLGLAEIGY